MPERAPDTVLRGRAAVTAWLVRQAAGEGDEQQGAQMAYDFLVAIDIRGMDSRARRLFFGA